MDKRESVIVDRSGESRAASGVWATIGIVILVVLLLFLLFGGLNLFTGNQQEGPTENPVTPAPTAPVEPTPTVTPQTETTPTSPTPTDSTTSPTTSQ